MQCVKKSNSTVAQQACAKDEWMVSRLTPAFAMANASGYDAGVALDMMHPFRSDIFLGGDATSSRVAVLATIGGTTDMRQMMVRVVEAASGNTVR
jgi:hypothetical protein